MSGAAFEPVNIGIAFCDIRMPEKITAVTAATKAVVAYVIPFEEPGRGQPALLAGRVATQLSMPC